MLSIYSYRSLPHSYKGQYSLGTCGSNTCLFDSTEFQLPPGTGLKLALSINEYSTCLGNVGSRQSTCPGSLQRCADHHPTFWKASCRSYGVHSVSKHWIRVSNIGFASPIFGYASPIFGYAYLISQECLQLLRTRLEYFITRYQITDHLDTRIYQFGYAYLIL